MANDAASYVESLYQAELGRSGAGDPGVGYWADAISSGAMSREAVANAIARSEEGARYDVGRAYQQELGRAAEDAGLQAWSQAISSGAMTAEEVRNAIARSQEGAAYDVNRLYQSELGRAANDPGAQYWRDALMSGQLDEAGLLSGIRGSQEYRGLTGGSTTPPGTSTPLDAAKLRAQMEADFKKQLEAQKLQYEKQLQEQNALRAQQQRTLQQSMQQNMMQTAVNNAAAGQFTPTAPLATAGATTTAGTTTAAGGLPSAAPVTAAPTTSEIAPAPTMYVPQTYLAPAPPQYRGFSPFQLPFQGATANPFESYFTIAQRRMPGMPVLPPGSVPAVQGRPTAAGPYIPVDGSTAGQPVISGPPAAYAYYSPVAPSPQGPMITTPVLPPTT